MNADSTNVCSEVTANIESGSTVTSGSSVTLTTATEGAEIYYTLDQTSPCDSESRILYTEPIVITEDTHIIAYAVKDGYEDSSTSEFIYTVFDEITDPSTLTGNTIIAAGYDENGTLLNFTIVTATSDDENLSLKCGSDTAYVKIMVWDSLSSMQPVYNAVTQTLK